MTRIYCHQCGYPIFQGVSRITDIQAQAQGFCNAGCQEVYETIKERLKETA